MDEQPRATNVQNVTSTAAEDQAPLSSLEGEARSASCGAGTGDSAPVYFRRKRKHLVPLSYILMRAEWRIDNGMAVGPRGEGFRRTAAGELVSKLVSNPGSVISMAGVGFCLLEPDGKEFMPVLGTRKCPSEEEEEEAVGIGSLATEPGRSKASALESGLPFSLSRVPVPELTDRAGIEAAINRMVEIIRVVALRIHSAEKTTASVWPPLD